MGRSIFLRRAGCGLLAAAVAWPLCACQSVGNLQTTSLVRVVDAAYNAPAVDVYAGKTEIAKNVAAGMITNYAILAPGPVTITMDAAGTAKPLATLTANLDTGGQHSVYLADAGSGFDAKLLQDQANPAPVGDFSVRFLQNAKADGPVNIYYLASGETIANANPVVKSLAPGQDSGYINVPDGNYRLVVTKAGSQTPIYTSSSTAYVDGEVRTMLIQSEPAAHPQPMRIVIGDDQN